LKARRRERISKKEEKKKNEKRVARSLISLIAIEIFRWLNELTKRKIKWKHKNEKDRIDDLCTDE
jgi:hypothetical protein